MICPYCEKGYLKYVGGNREKMSIPSVNLSCQNKLCSIRTWYRIPNYIPTEQIQKYFDKKGTAL